MKEVVKEAYGKIASGKGESCCTTPEFAKLIGYSGEDIKVIPQGADMSLGCGNPTALAGLKEGEAVLDLGSGGGIDCFLAASKVGPGGKVVGVDMTPEMIERARENARKANIKNVEFRLGEIEDIPVEDGSVDVVISNCVINLSPDKPKVFREVYRVLKPGGRIAISDIALLKELPKKIRESIEAYIGCIAGAITMEEYRKAVEASGLEDVRVTVKGDSSCIAPDTKDPIARTILSALWEGETLDDYVASVAVEGRKPHD
jgi:SAM-dependent methyltransferase